MNKKNIANPALRFLALLVDLMLFITAPVVIFEFVSKASNINPLLDSLFLLLTFMILWPSLIYPLIQIVLVNKLGGSFGKLLSGLEIIDKNDKFLSFKYALFRNYIGYITSSALFYLGFIWILVDKERRGWHDLISGSWVVVKRKIFALVGATSLIFLLALNVYLGSSIFKNIVTNLNFYQEIIDDAKSEIENLIKDSELENLEKLEDFDYEASPQSEIT